jgi:hypothetical protein
VAAPRNWSSPPSPGECCGTHRYRPARPQIGIIRHRPPPSLSPSAAFREGIAQDDRECHHTAHGLIPNPRHRGLKRTNTRSADQPHAPTPQNTKRKAVLARVMTGSVPTLRRIGYLILPPSSVLTFCSLPAGKGHQVPFCWVRLAKSELSEILEKP